MRGRILQGVFVTLCWGAALASEPPPLPVSLTAPAPVALITGSDRGIGLALTQELSARGWKVIATCRDPAHAQALRDFAQAHAAVTIEALDVSDNAAIAPADSARALANYIEELSIDKAGRFWSAYTGQEMPW